MAKIEETSINLQFFSSLLDSNISKMKKMLVHGANINFIKDGRCGLMIAVQRGDKKVVKFLIEKGADIDLKDHDGESALIRAINFGNVEIVNLLLKHGAEPNQTDNEGLPALTCACKKRFAYKKNELRQVEIVKLLLKHGANIDLQYTLLSVAMSANRHLVERFLRYGAQVDLQDKSGQSALILVSRRYPPTDEHIKVASLLIEHGANVNLQDFEGNSALILTKKEEMMTLLLKHGAQVNMQNNDGESALTRTFGESTVQLLLDHGAQVDLQDNSGFSVLMNICQIVNYYVPDEMGPFGLMEGGPYERGIHALLEGGAQVNLQNKTGQSALMFATQTGSSLNTVRLLLEHKADVNLQDETGKSSLMIAMATQLTDRKVYYKGQPNVQNLQYSLLLENGADVNLLDMEGKSALILACQNKTIHDVSTLLSWGAEVDLQDKEGWSALMWAAAEEDKETFKLKQLVGKKVAMNLRNREGRTALMIAILNGKTEAVKVLLHGGATIDSGDNDERSALVHASGRGHIEVAQLLLKYGAYLDWQDNEGYTPLMVACLNGCKQMTSFLINSGASIYLKNNDGKTAYDLALEKNYTDILEVFKKLRTNSSFPGILFSEDVRKESLTSSAKNIDLEDVGISLSIPEDALPSTDPPLEVQILPCISGSWEVPDNLELVSPAYIVEPSREAVFRKEVLVKIWHHANLESEEDCKDMVFLCASTTPEYRDGRPVYVFQEITGAKGSFRPREKLPAGEIALKHFCILGIFRYFFQCK